MIDDSRSVDYLKVQRKGKFLPLFPNAILTSTLATQSTLVNELILVTGVIFGFSAALFQINYLLFLSGLFILSSIVTSNNSDIQRTTTLIGFLIMAFMSNYIFPKNINIENNGNDASNS
ncbi:hypothetical protein RS030_1164 [Cryptosporidium xiaoi]|uniref:ER membrane protein complex subunit 6 n=1 Tax=Cryptosporidium xiaoi TaxID=659607 RepID=A0AAV9XZW7_9CRYT